MYKVKQIADMLDVETVLIHELLISYREELSPNVVKKNSITYIDYDGYQILKDLVQNFKDKIIDGTDLNEKVKVDNLIHFDTDNSINGLPSNYSKLIEDIEEVKNKISNLKQEINRVDIMINREEEALSHYRGILSKLL